MSGGAESPEYVKLCAFTQELVAGAERGNGFVFVRSTHAYHILLEESEIAFAFDQIRSDLGNKAAGQHLTESLRSGAIRRDASNRQIWESLMRSLEFNGVDFERTYGILPSSKGRTTDVAPVAFAYSFSETLVLTHTLLVAPVMQHYGPLAPKLNLGSTTKKLAQPHPLLVVGMIGDCLKGRPFECLQQRVEQGDASAQRQMETLMSPTRLQQKMKGLFHGLLRAREDAGIRALRVDACLVGAGAFGGSTKVLAQPFVDCLNCDDLPFDNSTDEVNFYMFPPPKQPDDLTLDQLRYNANLNPQRGLGSAAEVASNTVRVVVAGFDPVSLAPHGVMNRAVSAEGQLCHATDLLYRLTSVPGKFIPVQVPMGDAWDSPSVFFAPRSQQQPKYKLDEAYNTVRFVPEAALEVLGIKSEFEAIAQLVTTARAVRSWNGDSFEGWTLSHRGARGQTWKEVLRPAAGRPGPAGRKAAACEPAHAGRPGHKLLLEAAVTSARAKILRLMGPSRCITI